MTKNWHKLLGETVESPSPRDTQKLPSQSCQLVLCGSAQKEGLEKMTLQPQSFCNPQDFVPISHFRCQKATPEMHFEDLRLYLGN